MSVEDAILEAVRELSADKQQEILAHATQLRDAAKVKRPLRSIKGLWAGLGISLSAQEIEENQREMWKGFPEKICNALKLDHSSDGFRLAPLDRSVSDALEFLNRKDPLISRDGKIRASIVQTIW